MWRHFLKYGLKYNFKIDTLERTCVYCHMFFQITEIFNVLSTQNNSMWHSDSFQLVRESFVQHCYSVDFKTITRTTSCWFYVLSVFLCCVFFWCHKLQKMLDISHHALRNCIVTCCVLFCPNFAFRVARYSLWLA